MLLTIEQIEYFVEENFKHDKMKIFYFSYLLHKIIFIEVWNLLKDKFYFETLCRSHNFNIVLKLPRQTISYVWANSKLGEDHA